jgi:hypothetical protein
MFSNDVATARDRLIFMDNMHLKWTPDWQTAINKAIDEGYHVLPITPPLSEFMFCTNRSGHGVDNKLFFELAAYWGGYKFSPFMYKMISPTALKGGMKPLKADRFAKVKLIPWGGKGWLYVQDQYLGYIDREMVWAVMHAGNLMRQNDLEDVFLRKDGNIHITLIDPGRFQDKILIRIAEEIVKMYPSPPTTHYTGVGTLEDAVQDTQTYFLTVDEQSQKTWEDIISQASAKAGNATTLQPDGVHVTIGFTNKDIWRRDKRVTPEFCFPDPEAAITQPAIFLPYFRGMLNEVASVQREAREGTPMSTPLPNDANVGLVFQQQLRRRLQGRPIKLAADFPRAQLAILDYLIEHGNVNTRWRECPNGYYLIGFSVTSGKRYLSDDDAYKKNPRLQALVPRGLYHGLKVDKDGTVQWLGAVYPTSKFFGDNDTDEGVDMIGEEELKAEAHGGIGVKFILTEKANGEMFTFTVLDKVPSHNGTKYVVVCGSKNNKFLFELVLDGPKKTQQEELGAQIHAYLTPKEAKEFASSYKNNKSWTYTRVWLEMTDVFLAGLLTSPNGTWFCDMLFNGKFTACAEFESWLHPHLLAFPEGHQAHRIFAITTYNADGTPKNAEDTVRFAQLLELRDRGFGTVEINDTASHDVLEIRRDVWHRRNSEGVVLLVVKSGEIDKMIKMKTIWYVVHRGFRENLKRHVTGKSDDGPLTISQIKPGLHKKLRDKLAIFGLKKDESVYWQDYLESLAEYIVDARKRLGKQGLSDLFTYDYPKIIAGAEEIMEKHPNRRGKDEMEVYDVDAMVVGKRSPSPASGRSPKRGKWWLTGI